MYERWCVVIWRDEDNVNGADVRSEKVKESEGVRQRYTSTCKMRNTINEIAAWRRHTHKAGGHAQ